MNEDDTLEFAVKVVYTDGTRDEFWYDDRDARNLAFRYFRKEPNVLSAIKSERELR